MTITQIDPIQDPRWQPFVERHPDASVFHSIGWLKALQRTYGFRAVAYTTARAGEDLEDGIVFCDAGSWLTGKRVISLPFSDHCQPLVNSADLAEVISFIHADRIRAGQKFVEIRPLRLDSSILCTASSIKTMKSYCFHSLDLSGNSDDIFRNFHKDCVQRKIRRADKENLAYRSGQSRSLLRDFYGLQLLTRRHHGLPPQPFGWFSNLLDCLGNQLTIRTACKDGTPVAAMMTIRFRNTITYKYGCSNPNLNKLGGMPFLFWKTIEEGKQSGATHFDLGRSDLDNYGLIDFKDRLGASRSRIDYYRDAYTHDRGLGAGTLLNYANHILRKQIVPHLPDRLLMMAGNIMYKHVG